MFLRTAVSCEWDYVKDLEDGLMLSMSAVWQTKSPPGPAGYWFIERLKQIRVTMAKVPRSLTAKPKAKATDQGLATARHSLSSRRLLFERSLAGETPRWCETQSIHVTDGYYRNISTIRI